MLSIGFGSYPGAQRLNLCIPETLNHFMYKVSCYPGSLKKYLK